MPPIGKHANIATVSNVVGSIRIKNSGRRNL